MTKDEQETKTEHDPVREAQERQAEQREEAEQRYTSLREHAASLAEHDRKLGL